MQNLKLFASGKKSIPNIKYRVQATSAKDLKAAAQPRSLFASKGELGSLVVVSGSNDYYGVSAAVGNSVYNLLAGLRIGTGYACLFVPSSIKNAVEKLTQNMIVRTLGKSYISESTDKEKKVLREWMDRSTALVIGMGIGTKNVPPMRFAARLIDYAIGKNMKMVIDADGIRSLKYMKKRLNKNSILTPHDKEFKALTGFAPPEGRNIRGRIEAATRAAIRTNSVIVLKGHVTIITDGYSVKINKAKTSALATMGTGDVLAGIIGGYLATGCTSFQAASAGVYLHSYIGDALAKKMGTHILASDVVNYIPVVLKRFDKNAR